MNTPRKIFRSIACAASVAALSFFMASAVLAQGTAAEKRAALRTTGGRYLSAAANGGFDLNSQSILDKSIFTIIDLNGGELADGDEIKIKYTPGHDSDAGKTKPSFWTEETGKIKRVNKEPQNDAGTFKLKQQGDGFVFQTASGKFIDSLADGALTLAEKPGSGLIFSIEEQPAAR